MNFIEEKIEKKGNFESLRLRFPPEPSGHKKIINIDGKETTIYNSGLHLGHAKSICLNFGISKKYNTPCILRFDDTNPITEESEFVDSMISDINWLGFKPDFITYTSDYFDFIYECALTLIKKGLAYVDDSPSEIIASEKGTPTTDGKNSKFRKRSRKENLRLFEEMFNGNHPEGSKTLRAKIDMSSPNMILRDPILYRIVNKDHFRTGNKWKIYPMYDFAHPLSDYKEKITDSLCTLEFEIHRPLYMWVLENCNLEGPFPEETEFARLNVDYNIMSKRKIKKLIDNGNVDGWDDPRLNTLSGLRRRGYTPSSIIKFCEKIGVTKRESLLSHLLLEECLREDLNKSAMRYMGVMNPIKLTIKNWNGGIEWVYVENNPEDPSCGKRLVPFGKFLWIEEEDFRIESNGKFHRLKIGGEVRLKNAYIVKAIDVIEKNGKVIEVICEYDPSSKSGTDTNRKVKGTIHWVNRDYSINMPVNDYDVLFSHPNPDGNGKEYLDHFNANSKSVNHLAMFEPMVKLCKTGIPVQMIRKGYYVLDIDGKSWNRSVSLKEGWIN